MDGRVLERLPHGQVGVVQLDVLADQRDRHRPVAGVDLVHEGAPLGEVGVAALEAEMRMTSASSFSLCMSSGTW